MTGIRREIAIRKRGEKRNASLTPHGNETQAAESCQEPKAQDGTLIDPPHYKPILTCFSDIEPRKVDWLWLNRFPMGRISVLAGPQGLGKTFIVCDMAAHVSTGKAWPDGALCSQGSVIVVSCEDDPHNTLRPRLDAHGADVRYIHLLQGVERIDDEGHKNQTPFSLADVQALEMALQANPDCRLVIVDPVGAYLGGKVSASADNEVREVLSPVARLAEQYHVAVLVVAHHRKAAGYSADDLVLGSRAFTALARAVFHIFPGDDL